MIKRIIQEKIEMSLTKYPVVGILGKNVFTLPVKDLEKVFD